MINNIVLCMGCSGPIEQDRVDNIVNVPVMEYAREFDTRLSIVCEACADDT